MNTLCILIFKSKRLNDKKFTVSVFTKWKLKSNFYFIFFFRLFFSSNFVWFSFSLWPVLDIDDLINVKTTEGMTTKKILKKETQCLLKSTFLIPYKYCFLMAVITESNSSSILTLRGSNIMWTLTAFTPYNLLYIF